MQKVLLVDDSELCLAIQGSFLKRQNLKIFPVRSGHEAIDVHKREQVNLMLLDQHMPGLSGHEICRTIRSHSELQSVIIIMAISSSKEEDIGICFNAGANDYVIKPINPGELLKKIARYLDIPHRQSLRALSRVEIQIQNERKLLSGYTVNISTGGMLIESADEIKANDLLTIGLPIPGSSTQLKVSGTVVRIVEHDDKAKAPHFGIKFLNLTGHDMLAIHKYVGKQLDFGTAQQID